MSPPPIRFGTDGLRGPAGQWPLNEDGAATVGLALAGLLGGAERAPLIFIGRDTRESGPALSAALARGLAAGGARAIDAGVLPTAALSALVPARGAAGALMVTASHNAWPDNGVKVLGPDGRKFTESSALEAIFDQMPFTAHGELPPAAPPIDPDPLGPWRAAMPRPDLRGLRLLIDCAHGAAVEAAPPVLEALGATLVRRGCALAICLDGDADRISLVDAEAGLLDGDDLLWLLAGHGQGPVCGTVMSNGGLDAAMAGRLRRSAVGDQSLWLEMLESGAPIGAEPSGHVLFIDGLPTGDGLYAALRALGAVVDGTGRPRLPLPVGGWQRWAQASRKVPSGSRPSLDRLRAVAEAEAAGMRVVVRYSGTEPLLRILVEGPAAPEAWAARIADEFASLA